MKRSAIIGTAGAGKTTYLQHLKREYTKQGKSVLYLTFSRSAALEFAKREYNIEKLPQDILTIHSLSARILLSLNLITGEHLQKIKKIEKLKEIAIKHVDKKMKYSKNAFMPSVGNIKFNLINMYINTYYPRYKNINKVIDMIAKVDKKAAQIAEVYYKLKESEDVLDFNDLLIKAAEEAVFDSYDVIILDEAQDLTNLQWYVLDHIEENAERAIYAGDPFQSVYASLGASPFEFLNRVGDKNKIHLEYCYRLPVSIYLYAKRHISRVINERKLQKELEIQAEPVKDESGKIKRVVGSIYTAVFLALKELEKDKSVYILTRTNYLANKIVNEFINRRIVPGALKTNFHNPGLRKLHEINKFLEEVNKNGFKFTKKAKAILEAYGNDDVKKLIERVKNDDKQAEQELAILLDNRLQEAQKSNKLDEIFTETEIKQKYQDLLDLFELDGKEKELLRKGIVDESKKLKIDTIHASKGREADTVILVNMSKTSKNSLFEDFLWFVGITRARKKLIILNPKKNNKAYKPWYLRL